MTRVNPHSRCEVVIVKVLRQHGSFGQGAVRRESPHWFVLEDGRSSLVANRVVNREVGIVRVDRCPFLDVRAGYLRHHFTDGENAQVQSLTETAEGHALRMLFQHVHCFTLRELVESTHVQKALSRLVSLLMVPTSFTLMLVGGSTHETSKPSITYR